MSGPLEALLGDEYEDTMVRLASRWVAIVAASAAVGVAVPQSIGPGYHRVALAIVFVAMAPYFVALAISRRFTTFVLRHLVPLMAASCATTLLLVALAGPTRQESVIIIPAFLATATVSITRRQVLVMFVGSAAGFAAIVAFGEGYTGPVSRWFVAMGFTAGCLFTIDWVMQRLQQIGLAERVATAEVHRLNQQLEERVDDLGRFLSPQVAAAVRDLDDRSVLEPHRRQIAVLFCDLRGFTAFTSGAEPEDVVEVLTAYYAAVGEPAHGHGATIGSFIGDGVMAYFGDPVPMDDAAQRAVATAVDVRRALRDLAAAWRRRGFDLGFGIGIAYGYATLGTVGFEGRRDYTALGSVVNLASRLCGEAADSEILLDPRAVAVLDGAVATEARTVKLKGFGDAVEAHLLAM